MRLLFLTNFFPPYDLGGFEQWCHEIAGTLQARGHSIKVLTSQYGITQGYLSETDVIRSLFLQADIDWYRPKDFFTKRSIQERHNSNELRKALKHFSPDMVVVWGMWNLSRNLPHLAEVLMPGRVVYYFASYWPIDEDVHLEYWKVPARRFITELVKRPLRYFAISKLEREGYPPKLQYQNAMCCSQYVRNELVTAKIVPTTTGVLYGGIDPQPFLGNSALPKFDRTPLRLVYFGSLLPKKGVHTIIEALNILKKIGLSQFVELGLIGGGHPDYVTRLKNQVQLYELANSVHFLGRVPRDQIPTLLNEFDVFIFSSIWMEPMARTVMEAMAAGLLVIASRAGGQVEMLEDGYNSLTFEPGDAPELASKIIFALQHPAERITIAQAGNKLVLEQFTLEHMVVNIENWLEKTLLGISA
jgi:glycogen synthase